MFYCTPAMVVPVVLPASPLLPPPHSLSRRRPCHHVAHHVATATAAATCSSCRHHRCHHTRCVAAAVCSLCRCHRCCVLVVSPCAHCVAACLLCHRCHH